MTDVQMSCAISMQKEEAQAALINNNMDLRSAIGKLLCHLMLEVMPGL